MSYPKVKLKGWRVRPLGYTTPWKEIEVITATSASDAAETWAQGENGPALPCVEVVADNDWINIFRFELNAVWAIYAVEITDEES